MQDVLAAALQRHQSGQLDEAVGLYRQVLTQFPDSANALHLLGVALLALGRPAEAVEPLRRLAQLQAAVPVPQLLLGDALRGVGRLEEAKTAYLYAVRLQPLLADAHAKLGLLLRAQNKNHKAFASLQRATDLEPTNAAHWKHLAEWHAHRGDYGNAIPCWQQALALQPEQVSLHLGLSSVLQDAGRFAEAEAAIRHALRLQPDAAAAQYGLGSLYEALGDKTQAEVAFRAALQLHPAFTLAWERLVQLLHGRLSDADRAIIEGRLADPHLPATERVKLLFASAAIADAGGDYHRAADCARTANALKLDRARRRGLAYDPVRHHRFVDGAIQAFDADFFQRTASMGLETQRPVFVFGLPRSGTSLVEQILASHGRVFGAGELRLAWQALEEVPQLLGRTGDPLAAVPDLKEPAIRQLGEQYLARLTNLDAGRADRIIDKMPENYLYLGLLAALFPRATFLHCRRDLRDVAVSCWLTNFAAIDWSNDVGHLAARFAEYRRLMGHFGVVLPVKVHEVVYEEIVADLEGKARRLIAVCGLEWDPACLEFHRTRRAVRTASATQVRTPIYRRSVGRWRHYERELADLFERLPDTDQ